MIPMLACMMLTLGILVYVFYLPGTLHLGPEMTRLSYLKERKEAVYENLRDLNFEFKAGKLPRRRLREHEVVARRRSRRHSRRDGSNTRDWVAETIFQIEFETQKELEFETEVLLCHFVAAVCAVFRPDPHWHGEQWHDPSAFRR